MDIITRSEAIAKGYRRYFTGEPCKNGHVAERLVSNRGCWLCQVESRRVWGERNPEKVSALKAKERESLRNRRGEEILEYKRKYFQRNKSARYEAMAEWRRANPDKMWEIAQRHKAKRKAAIPSDFDEFDKFVILEAYRMAKRRESITGYPWHVDHMIPVCQGGKHSYRNIQVIPASLNMRKGGKLIYTKPMEWIGSLPGA